MKNLRLYKILFSATILSLLGCSAFAGYFDTLNTISNKADCRFVVKKIFFEKLIYINSDEIKVAYSQLLMIAEKRDKLFLKAYAALIMGKFYSSPAFLNQKKALEQFNIAKKIATAEEYSDIEAEVYHQTGWVYYWSKNYPIAFEYFFKSNSLIKKIGYENYYFVTKHLYDIGFLYYDFGDNKQAKLFLTEAIKYPVPVKKYMIDNYNTLGLVYRELKEDDSAINYFTKTIELAKEVNDTAWIGIATGNLAYMNFRQKKYDVAIPMFLTDYTISKKHKDWAGVSAVLTTLGLIYIERGEMKAAAASLAELDTVIVKVNDPSLYWHYYVFRAKFFSAKKDFTNAYRYLDSSIVYHKLRMQRNDSKMIIQAEQKAEVEKYFADIQLLKSEKDGQLLLRNTIIICAILSLIIAIQFIHRLKIKQKRNVEVLNTAKTQLKHYIESIRDKNQLIDTFKQEINRLNSFSNSPVQAEKEAILHQLQNSTILTDDDWDEFRHLFDKVHKGFFTKLKLRYPNLTNSEMRLMALTKLNLSKKEMAEMLGISPDSIKKTRQRALKKLNLSEEETLDEMVLKL